MFVKTLVVQGGVEAVAPDQTLLGFLGALGEWDVKGIDAFAAQVAKRYPMFVHESVSDPDMPLLKAIGVVRTPAAEYVLFFLSTPLINRDPQFAHLLAPVDVLLETHEPQVTALRAKLRHRT